MANKEAGMNLVKYGPRRAAAYEDWKRGMPYAEIADKYGISVQSVKNWARRYFKPKAAFDALEPLVEPGSEPSPAIHDENGKDISTTPSRMALAKAIAQEDVFVDKRIVEKVQPAKFGKYSKLIKEELTDEEAVLYNRMKIDPVKQLEGTIKLLTIQELRLLNHLNRLEDDKAMITEYEDVIIPAKNGEKTGTIDRRIRRTKLALDKMLQLQETLLLVQERKMKAVKTREALLNEAAAKEEAQTKVVIVSNIPRPGN